MTLRSMREIPEHDCDTDKETDIDICRPCADAFVEHGDHLLASKLWVRGLISDAEYIAEMKKLHQALDEHVVEEEEEGLDGTYCESGVA